MDKGGEEKVLSIEHPPVGCDVGRKRGRKVTTGNGEKVHSGEEWK